MSRQIHRQAVINTTCLEAFSDGVLAIVITIMVLEIKVPRDTGPAALVPLIPVFLSYLLSFVSIGIEACQRPGAAGEPALSGALRLSPS